MRSLLIALLLVPGMALAQTQAEFQKKYDSLIGAIRKSNLPAVEAWIGKNASKEFTYQDGRGKNYNRVAFIESLRQQFLLLTRVKKSTFQIVRFQAKPKLISVTIDSQISGVFSLDERGTPSAVELRNRTLDLWTLVGKEWKLRRKTTLQERVTVDGKVYRVDELLSSIRRI
ncbi:MAG: hypothetical protein ACOYON_03440 [Fimbriimonas sp.]